MTCQQLIEFIMSYLDGELSQATRTEFESHLGECPECVAYLDSYRKTVELTRRESTEQGDEIPERLVRLIMSSMNRHQ